MKTNYLQTGKIKYLKGKTTCSGDTNNLDGWDIWERNFYNAKRFFDSKGNTKTRSRLKDKWFKDFKKDLEDLDVQLHEQFKK
uniref:Uncharacterized protein n=1 Tax=viral metagenome TaxID=1070528 RepID=A0A6M3XER0_9ZZZZ